MGNSVTSFAPTGDFTLTQVDDRFWIGNEIAASQIRTLMSLHINYAISLEVSPKHNFFVQEQCVNNGILFQSIPIHDNGKADIKSIASKVIQLLQQNPYMNILVYCHHEQSRSPAVAIAYLMEKYNMTEEQAFQYIQSKNPNIKPKTGFLNQLF